ncbi:MAG: PQQ-dependent sugar dehydrogenase [Nonlabens sp.]
MNRYIPLYGLLFILFSCKKGAERLAIKEVATINTATSSQDIAQDLTKLELEDDVKDYTVESVIPDLDNPWGMTWLPNGNLLVTEKDGKLIRFDGNKKYDISNVPEVYVRGQGGLLDVILHPDYSKNGWLYLSYASQSGEGKGGHTAIARAKLVNDALEELQVLYKASPNTRKGQHFGSRFAWGNDGKLYFSIGERGNREVNPQDITRDGGKIYRINDDGSIPEDNPFYNNTGAVKAIYTYGNRNPQGLLKHPVTGAIISHEHGPKGGDEINLIKAGINYGWPVISYGINYNGTEFTDKTAQEGMEQPLAYWDPSIAPSGFAVVYGDQYPDWENNFLVGSLKFQYLEMLTVDKNYKVLKRQKLADGIGRLRNVKMGPDGLIYLGVEGSGIYKILPKT